MARKDCPMCGEVMQIVEHEITDRVPGTPQTWTSISVEWVCPECEYFEDLDDEDAEGG